NPRSVRQMWPPRRSRARANQGRRVQEKPGPVGSCKRPFILFAQLELLAKWTAQVQPDARLLVPSVLLTLEEVIEEALLQCHAVSHVEPFLMAARMSLQPFLPRARLGEGLKITARMQAEAGPIGRAEERHIHL